MKKTAICAFTAVVMLGMVSCKDYMGTYPHQETMGTQRYMEAIVTGYLADHLWVMERALIYDESKIYQTIRKSAEYDTDGNGLWQAGTVWKASEVTALSGISIEKTQEDSTWVLRRNDKASGKGFPAYPTDSEVTLRMLPTDDDAPRHEWRLYVDKFVRTEDFGYKADFSTQEAAEFRVAGSGSSWASCKGTFWMDVTRDGELVDKAVLVYNGSTDSATFYHELLQQ